MKLEYDKNTYASCGMEKQAHRIEIHLLRLNPQENNPKLYTVVILSGQNETPANKHKLQGPFQTRDTAIAVIRAIVKALENEHYELSTAALVWGIQAQALIKNNRAIRSENQTNTDFTPLGVIPDSE